MYVLLLNSNIYCHANEIASILRLKYTSISIKNNIINNKYIKFYSEMFDDSYVHQDVKHIFQNLSNKYNINCDFLLYKELTRSQILI
jgi:hypothetical protein